MMRCGTRCFVVTFERDDEQITEEFKARSQVDARKIVKKHYGNTVSIKSVIKKDAHD